MADLIVPEIYSQLLTEKVKGKVKISSVATDIGTLGDFANEGDSITFPKFTALSDAELLSRGATITAEELKQTTSKKEVKHYGKGVTIYDIDAKTGKGNFLENAINQQADIFARAIDKEMVADIDANAVLKYAVNQANGISGMDLYNAFQLFGDEQDNADFEQGGIFINSLLLKSIIQLDEFVSSNKTFAKEGNGIIANGIVGYWRGSIPVILTDRGTYDETLKECKTYIVKNGALGIKSKEGVNIEVEREASKKATNVYADDMFAVGLVQTDGVVVVRKTIA